MLTTRNFPFNIHRMNRRQILTASAAGITMSVSCQLSAAEGLKPLSFVVVSDTHLGRNDNTSAEKNWRQAIQEINTQPGQFVLHLGDIVDRGREAQYPIYTETRTLLNKPIHEIPGNHDPTDFFRKHVAPETDQCIDYGEVRILMLNNAHRDSHDGFISIEQLDWFAEHCAEAVKENLKIVLCCHVPIHSNRNPDRGWYVKPENGQQKFYELQRRFSDQLLVCLHGHFHNGIRGWRDHGQMVEVLCPSTCYNQNRNLTGHLASGKATGFFVDELRPGYTLAELGEGRLTLKYKPLGQTVNGRYTADWG